MPSLNIIEYSLIAIVILLLTFFYLDNKHLKQVNSDLSNELLQIKSESKILNDRVEEAQKKASENEQQSQKQADKILYIKVPKTCEAAIAWGIDQAKAY